MRLNHTAVRLRLQLIGDLPERKDAQIEPGRYAFHYRNSLSAAEDELTDDLLSPGGSGLAPCSDDNVTIAELEIDPPGGVEQGILQFTRFLGPRYSGSRHSYFSPIAGEWAQ